MPTKEELTETFQDQADLFDLIQADNRFLFENMPITDIFAILSANPNDIVSAQEFLFEYLNLNVLPVLVEQIEAAQNQAVKTADAIA